MAKKATIEKYLDAFELWFEFFKESDPSKRAASVTAKFGELDVTFTEWWKAHNQLFSDVDPFGIEVLNSSDDFEWFDDDADVVRVAVSLLESKDDLRAAFEKLLQEYHPGKTGPKPFEHHGEVFSLCARPDVPALRTTLRVWRYCKENPDLTLDVVEKNLGLITKNGPRMHAHWNQIDSPNADKLQRKTQADEVNRHLRRARKLIDNVAIGIFPMLE